MNILTLGVCENIGILKLIYFLYLGLEVLSICIPIALILMLLIDFSRAVITNKADEQLKSMKLVIRRIIYAILIFAIPFIVNLFITILSKTGIDTGTDYNVCINTIKDIISGADSMEKYDSLYDAQQEIEQSEIEYNKDKNVLPDSPNKNADDSVAQRLVSLIKAEVGKKDRTKYGSPSGSAWCGYFTTWALKNTEMDDGKTVYNYLAQFGGISDGAASGLWPAFRGGKDGNVKFNKSKSQGGNYLPKAGDVIWFQWPADWSSSYCRKNYGNWNGTTQCSDHVGLVTGCDGSKVYTVEGNSGGQVSAKEYSVNSDYIIAYGSWY